MRKGRGLINLLLVMAMLLAMTCFAVPVTAQPAADDEAAFIKEQESKFIAPDTEFGTEVRWWLAGGYHSDETLRETVQELHDAGFSAMELCILNATGATGARHGYGSQAWVDSVRTVLEEANKYDMSIAFTSGTHWGTANVPGLNTNSQAASQSFTVGTAQYYAGGATRPAGSITAGTAGRPRIPIVAVAWELAEPNRTGNVTNPTRLKPDTFIDLTDQLITVTEGSAWSLPAITFPASQYGWHLFLVVQQPTMQTGSGLASQTSYTINYMDIRGVEAMMDYWGSYYFENGGLGDLVRENGRVQLFIDSLETSPNAMYWAEDMAEVFMDRKGYDIRPYLPMFVGSGSVFNEQIILNRGQYVFWGEEPEEYVFSGLANNYNRIQNSDRDLRVQIRNDLFDIHTSLLRERMMDPLREWLNKEYNVKLRAQISYGQYFEITEMALATDYVENESRNMRSQPDAFRAHSGAAKLMNTMYSDELGGHDGMNYMYSLQDYLQHAYAFYSVGGNRVIWHGYATISGPAGTVTSPSASNAPWPGYEAGMGTIAGRLGKRDPGYKDYKEFNGHLSRLQEALRAGTAPTDLGVLYIDYAFWCRRTFDPQRGLGLQNYKGIVWEEEASFQENGYTYDYVGPGYLTTKNRNKSTNYAWYDAATDTVSPDGPGYQALVVFQPWMPAEPAEELLAMAKNGLKLIILEGALTKSPYYGEVQFGANDRLAEIRAELLALPNVAEAATQADAVGALKGLGVAPRAGFDAPQRQIMTQMRKDDSATYLYMWNHTGMPGSKNSIYPKNPGHAYNNPGANLNPRSDYEGSVVLDGLYRPYVLDTWTGKVSPVTVYSQVDGKTIIPASLAVGDVAVYILRDEIASDPTIVYDGGADSIFVNDGSYIVRATGNGVYDIADSIGNAYKATFDNVPDTTSLKGWTLNVESWNRAGTTVSNGFTTRPNGRFAGELEGWFETLKTPIGPISLENLTTWNNIPAIGQSVSGIGVYETTFDWDASAADGAYLDLGVIVQTAVVEVNGRKTAPVNMNTPVVDISEFLVSGVNTLKITVTTSLTNRQIANGYLSQGIVTGSAWVPATGANATYTFYEDVRRYREFGLSQAELIPFVETEVSTYIGASAFAEVTKLNGNKNDLTITVTEYFANGFINTKTVKFSIDNNAIGTYSVGPYKVYVDTKGNVQIRSIYIANQNEVYKLYHP